MSVTALQRPAKSAFLSREEIDALILRAQDVAMDPSVRDGVYIPTDDSDRALSDLTAAFLPLLHSVAGSTSNMDADDALGFVLEEFVSCVRRYQVGSALPFKAGLRTILSRRLGDEARADTVIVVKSNASGRYQQLMESVDWDVNAAYELCRTTENGFTPDTFLAVHNALTGASPLPGSEGDPSFPDIEEYLATVADDPEESTVQSELVAYLFDLVTDQQERILRLAYGFTDPVTETVRATAGIHPSETVLSDRQVAQCIGSSQPTVNRQRRAALAVMLAALIEGEEV